MPSLCKELVDSECRSKRSTAGQTSVSAPDSVAGLGVATSSALDRTGYILQMQRQYGNRYVQRMLAFNGTRGPAMKHSAAGDRTIQRSPANPPINQPPEPDKASEKPLPQTRDGQPWAKPEAARQYLQNYEVEIAKKMKERDALSTLVAFAERQRQIGIHIQKRATETMNDIIRNDIWPNWGTLNHTLTFVGTWAGCMEGGCLIAWQRALLACMTRIPVRRHQPRPVASQIHEALPAPPQ